MFLCSAITYGTYYPLTLTAQRLSMQISFVLCHMTLYVCTFTFRAAWKCHENKQWVHFFSEGEFLNLRTCLFKTNSFIFQNILALTITIKYFFKHFFNPLCQSNCTCLVYSGSTHKRAIKPARDLLLLFLSSILKCSKQFSFKPNLASSLLFYWFIYKAYLQHQKI